MCGCKKNEKTEIGKSRGGLSTKIHAIVDSYGYPVFLTLTEGQKHDASEATNILSQVPLENNNVIADKGYDSDNIVDFIYEKGAEPTIPTQISRKVQRRCDWWLYKERHLVECFFLKIKNFRRVATRYDKLAHAFMGFVCIASISVWLK